MRSTNAAFVGVLGGSGRLRRAFPAGHRLALLAAAALLVVGLAARSPAALLALVAGALLIVPRDPRTRAAGAAVAFGVALAAAFLSSHLILALVSVVGLLAALAGLPRRDPWRGAYF